MLSAKPFALAALVFVAAGLAHAERSGASGSAASSGDGAKKRDMPVNDDFQSITFRAGAGGSSPSCCPGDFDCNGIIDASDLAVLLGAWGFCGGCAADVDLNGVVDASDLAVVLSGWGPCAG
jgi:hypothetical protein